MLWVVRNSRMRERGGVVNKRTKIIGTLGPATESETTIHAMIVAGMDLARLNFSHGTHEEHRAHIENLKKVRKKMETPLYKIIRGGAKLLYKF